MSDPEISRRCSACGASVRQRALFCPQCGTAIGSAASQTDTDSARTVAEKAVENTQIEVMPETVVDSPRSGLAATEPLRIGTLQTPENAPTQALNSVSPPVRPRPRQEDGIRSRVDKLKKVSSVVIDQAAYDPSLRFLLVAACLFLLFVVLLIMSKVIG
jgi:zinc-ribbon domain